MPYPLQSIAHGAGVWPGNLDDIPLFVRNAAAVKGETWMNDFAASDGEVSTAGPTSLGLSTSVWNNMIKPSSAGINFATGAGAFFGVAQAGVAENGVTNFKLYGFVNALVIGDSGSMAIGTDLVPTTSAYLDIVTAFQERVIAVGQAAVASPTAATSGAVFFNGIGHIGQGCDVSSN